MCQCRVMLKWFGVGFVATILVATAVGALSIGWAAPERDVYVGAGGAGPFAVTLALSILFVVVTSRRRRWRALQHASVVAAIVASTVSCSDPSPTTDGGTPTDGGSNDAGVPVGIATRPSNTSCSVPPRPGGTAGALTTEPLFPGVTGLTGFTTDLKRAPAEFPGWFVITREGNVRYVADGATAAVSVIGASDLESGSRSFTSGNETGLLGIAVDPDYPSVSDPNRIRIFLSYTGDLATDNRSFLVRFDLNVTGSGASATPAIDGSAVTVLTVRQPYINHNGGGLNFGGDGYLYATYGDGGRGNDPWCNAQNLGTLLGKMLRIDVHSGSPYSIPNDNPYRLRADGTTARPLCNALAGLSWGTTVGPDTTRSEPCPEIFAYGLRNPFRFSFDDAGNQVWIGDVGQSAVEEVDRAAIPPTGVMNFGWPLIEGPSSETRSNSACDALALDVDGAAMVSPTAPVFYYRHSYNGSRQGVTGGYVYRGSALGGAYAGRYFFSDFGTSELWTMASPYSANEQNVDANSEPFVGSYGYAIDDDRELITITASGPQRIVLSGGPAGGPATMLSATGCVDPLDVTQPAPGLIPYDVNAKLYTDGAVKRRYLALPNGTTIDRSGNCGALSEAECLSVGQWEFPIGTVLMKYFHFEGRYVETRFLVRHDDGGWGAYTYLWNDAQNDAVLIDGSQTYGSWTAPSRTQCLECHTVNAGSTLGPMTAQLNGPLAYPSGTTANQLDTLNHIGLFTQPLSGRGSDEAAMPAIGDTSASNEARSRAYLHSNCSHCHRPGSAMDSIDLRYSTPLAAMGICNVVPTDGALAADVRILLPGDASRSLISMRQHETNPTATPSPMPPLGRSMVDSEALTVIDAWIDAMSGCPAP